MTGRNGNGASLVEAVNPATHRPTATKVVCLVGTATTSRDLVHEQGEDVEVWGLNSSYSWMPRWSRWFEVHDRDRYSHIVGDHLAWLQAQECPVYMQKHHEDIPASVAFPYEFVLQGRFRPLFTSSVAYMLALAIAEGFTEIRLAGIDMAMDNEYAYQRSACEYWLGVAEALGITVTIPSNSPIGKAPVYGRDAMELQRSIDDWKPRLELDQLTKFENGLERLRKLEQEHGQQRQEAFAEITANLAGVAGAMQLLQLMKQQDG